MQRLLNYISINTILIALLTSILGYGMLSYYLQKPDPYEAPIGNLPVPIQVGRNKLIVSKTGDASMQTENRRRRAIIGGNSCAITPKFSYSGSTNGSLETYFLSSICPSFIKDILEDIQIVILDGGNAGSEFIDVIDGNEPHEFTIDSGDATTNIFSM